MTFERFDLVLVPFPFTDQDAVQVRPAVVLSSWEEFGSTTDHLLLAMVTTAKRSQWPLDTPIEEWQLAGLRQPCAVRLKLFTLTIGMVLQKIGSLATDDAVRVLNAMRRHID